MISRDIREDVGRSIPLDQLGKARAELAASSMIWHALVLPLAETRNEPRVVVTGHIVCHDCALCVLAGDLRDPSAVAVPWRHVYSDCCDDDDYAGDGFDTYNDAIAGPLQVPVDVAESLRAVFSTHPDGRLLRTGWSIPRERAYALIAFAEGLPEVAAQRVSHMFTMCEIGAGCYGPVFPFASERAT